MGAEIASRRVRHTIAIAFVAIGGVVLLVSLGLIMERLDAVSIWNLAAHEDGVRTFGDTVLYFEHAIRELPLDFILGVAIGGGLAFALPLQPQSHAPWSLVLALLLTLAVMFTGAISDVGIKAFIHNLLQNHTRPGAPLEWGAHWRYHLLARLALLLMTFAGAGLLRLVAGAGAAADAEKGAQIIFGALAVFVVGTLIFAHSIPGMVEPFADPVFIGHEARELFTHVIVTMPVAWGVGILAAGDNVLSPASGGDRRYRMRLAVASMILAVVIGLYLCGLAVTLDSASSGQTEDVVMLLAPHFFEHAQTSVVVTLVALVTHRLAARRTG